MFIASFIFLASGLTHVMLYIVVNTIALTKPEKAQKVEYMLAQMARSGQIQEKVSLSCSNARLFLSYHFHPKAKNVVMF